MCVGALRRVRAALLSVAPTVRTLLRNSFPTSASHRIAPRSVPAGSEKTLERYFVRTNRMAACARGKAEVVRLQKANRSKTITPFAKPPRPCREFCNLRAEEFSFDPIPRSILCVLAAALFLAGEARAVIGVSVQMLLGNPSGATTNTT